MKVLDVPITVIYKIKSLTQGKTRTNDKIGRDDGLTGYEQSRRTYKIIKKTTDSSRTKTSRKGKLKDTKARRVHKELNSIRLVIVHGNLIGS